MEMYQKECTMIFILAILSFVVAEEKGSTAFDKMLNTLLSHSVNEIRVEEAKNDTMSIFIDAREKKEYEVSHIKNAVWVGYDDFDTLRLDGIDRNTHLIVYCSIGYRSEKITERLLKAGFINSSNMVGGIFDWKNSGYDVFDKEDKMTENVHGFNKLWAVWLRKGRKVLK
jgi:rhodanese-related sulfurtransferase